MVKETLTASDYEVIERRQSQIDPDATVIVRTGIKCPRCKTVLPVLVHAESQKCGGCGLHMTLYGNALQCRA